MKKTKKKTTKKTEQLYGAQRFARHIPDFDFTWIMENISDKPMKELDRTERARYIGEWIVWIKDLSVHKGRRVQYDASAFQMNRANLGPRP